MADHPGLFQIDANIAQHILAHLDPPGRLALFRSSRTTRGWVLEGSEKASLQLNVSERARSPKQLPAVRSALITRTTSRTVLVLDQCPTTGPGAGQIIAQLQGATACVTEVVIRALSTPELSTVPPFPLPCAALSHITSLQPSPCSFKLPPSKHLPQLRSLSATLLQCRTDGGKKALYNSINAYLAQLVSLQLDRPAGARHQLLWSRLFTPATTTHTLTKLSTDAPLCDQLLRLLLKHAPRLQELAALELALSESFRDEQWGLRRLDITRAKTVLGSSELSLLPHRDTGRLDIVCLDVIIDLGDPDPGRLTECVFPMTEFPEFDLPDSLANGDTDILRATLRRELSNLRAADNAKPVLANWPWTSAVAAAAADVLAALKLRVSVCLQAALCDDTLQHVLVLGTSVWELMAPSICLRESGQADKPWPWEVLTLLACDSPSQLSKLPHPKSRTEGPGLEKPLVELPWTFPAQQVEQQADWLIGWLPHVRLTVLEPGKSTLYDTYPLFRANYAVLRHVAAPRDILRLPDQSMTCEAIEALRGLPEWDGTLDMSGCRWPLEPSVYRERIAHCIPLSYRVWVVWCAVGSRVLDAICDAVNERRARLDMPPLTVQVVPKWGQDKRRGEHVIVTARNTDE